MIGDAEILRKKIDEFRGDDNKKIKFSGLYSVGRDNLHLVSTINDPDTSGNFNFNLILGAEIFANGRINLFKAMSKISESIPDSKIYQGPFI